MDRQTVIAKLCKHEPELRASGITGLSLFGSVARGENTHHSDVDLMADFDQTRRMTLFSLSGVRLQIVDILGTSVDLADRRMLKDQLKVRAEREEALSSKDPNQPLRDILDSLKLIEDFTSGMSFEQFREDAKTIATVERKLLLIGEAAVRIGRDAPFENS